MLCRWRELQVFLAPNPKRALPHRPRLANRWRSPRRSRQRQCAVQRRRLPRTSRRADQRRATRRKVKRPTTNWLRRKSKIALLLSFNSFLKDWTKAAKWFNKRFSFLNVSVYSWPHLHLYLSLSLFLYSMSLSQSLSATHYLWAKMFFKGWIWCFFFSFCLASSLFAPIISKRLHLLWLHPLSSSPRQGFHGNRFTGRPVDALILHGAIG